MREQATCPGRPLAFFEHDGRDGGGTFCRRRAIRRAPHRAAARRGLARGAGRADRGAPARSARAARLGRGGPVSRLSRGRAAPSGARGARLLRRAVARLRRRRHAAHARRRRRLHLDGGAGGGAHPAALGDVVSADASAPPLVPVRAAGGARRRDHARRHARGAGRAGAVGARALRRARRALPARHPRALARLRAARARRLRLEVVDAGVRDRAARRGRSALPVTGARLPLAAVGAPRDLDGSPRGHRARRHRRARLVQPGAPVLLQPALDGPALLRAGDDALPAPPHAHAPGPLRRRHADCARDAGPRPRRARAAHGRPSVGARRPSDPRQRDLHARPQRLPRRPSRARRHDGLAWRHCAGALVTTTSSVSGWPLRRTPSATWLPGARSQMANMSPRGVSLATDLPSTVARASPRLRPALSAGLPGRTPSTRGPSPGGTPISPPNQLRPPIGRSLLTTTSSQPLSPSPTTTLPRLSEYPGDQPQRTSAGPRAAPSMVKLPSAPLKPGSTCIGLRRWPVTNRARQRRPSTGAPERHSTTWP